MLKWRRFLQRFYELQSKILQISLLLVNIFEIYSEKMGYLTQKCPTQLSGQHFQPKNAIFRGILLSKQLVIRELTQLSGKTQFLTVQLSGFNCITFTIQTYISLALVFHYWPKILKIIVYIQSPVLFKLYHYQDVSYFSEVSIRKERLWAKTLLCHY